MLSRSGSLAILILNVIGILSLVFISRSWAQTDQIKIKQIEILGNNRIETEAIRARIRAQAGDPFLPNNLRKDLKRVYQMGYFEDIRIEIQTHPDGIFVGFVVVERPFLVDIQYFGNKQITEDQIKDRVTLRTQIFVDPVKIKNNAERIRRYYEEEGYHRTEVIPVLNRLEEDRVGLIYYIKEGMKAKVRNVEFSGREAIPAQDLLKPMETGEYSLFSTWVTNTGYYKEEALDLDLERIREVYLNNGYLEVQVGVPDVRLQDRRQVGTVTFPVSQGDLDQSYEFREVSAMISIPVIEGEQFYIRNIEISGNRVFGELKILSKLKLKSKDLFQRDKLRRGVSEIQEMYGEKGYLYADVIPQFKTYPEDRTVDLILQVSEDQQIHVRRINISGNDKTRDKVIRREIRLDEQEIINTRLLRRSFQRINNLNFFETIEINPQRVSDTEVDLSVRVKEKSTGAMSIGGGYNSQDSVVGLAEITQGNLFGRGQLLRGRGQFGKRRTTYSLTFREKYLFDKPVSGTFDLFNTRRNFNSYQERRLGGDVIFGKEFTEHIKASLKYKWETLKIFDLDDIIDENPDDEIPPHDPVPSLIREQEGSSITSSLRATLSRDTRDFFFDPREGGKISLSGEYAGTFMGGTNDFIRTIVDASKFYPLIWNTVFSVHGRFGYGAGINGEELPIGERFFVGGINTIRGFKFGEAGPCKNDQDELVSCREGDIIGGNKELLINIEFLFPLVTEAKIRGLLFFDAGRAFDDEESIRLEDLRTSAGFGVRWISPIGPLRLEWAYILDREPGEDPNKLEFSIGTLF